MQDFVAYARVFYPWLRTRVEQRLEPYRSVAAAVNTILYELRLFIWDRAGDYVLDKPGVIPAALDLECGALPREAFQVLQQYIVGNGPLSPEEVEPELRAVSEYVREQVSWSVPPFTHQ